MKALSNSDKLRAFIDPKIIDLITFLGNNVNSTVYKGGYIHGIYRYLDMIGYPTTLTTSGQLSNNFRPYSSINNNLATLRTVIVDIRTK